MDGNSVAGLGLLMAFAIFAGIIFLIVLFVAPIKLYSIHRGMRRTNDLLRVQTDLLAKIEDRERAQVGLLAAVANMSKEQRERLASGNGL